MTTKKKLIDGTLRNLSGIRNYQNEIISCLDEAGIALGEINDILEDTSTEVSLEEELSKLMDAAYRLEGWAIAHHQTIQALGEILTKIEKTQNRKRGRKC